MAIRVHFNNESYNMFEHKGNLKSISKETFDSHNAKFKFEKLSQTKTDVEIRDIFLSNIIHDSKWCIHDAQSQSRYLKFKGYKAARTYHFRNEVKSMYEYSERHDINYSDIFKDINGNCIALNSYLGGEISIDTFLILDTINPFIETICNESIKKSLCQTATKYKPFLKVKLEDFIKIESELSY
jgi:hypothetical protein